MTDRILIIEDEPRIARVLQLELNHEGYDAAWADNGVEGLERAREGGWSCILLDLQLPGLDGLSVLRELRKSEARVPVLIMTAREAVSDKVEGLDSGANDYVTKPFEYEELSARIRALIRTYEAIAGGGDGNSEQILTVDGLHVDPKNRMVTRDGEQLELTPREFDLLIYLLRNPNTHLSREKLLAEVWGYDFAGETNLVDVYIRYLRQKVDKGRSKKLIRTVRGVGYAIREPEQP